MEKEKKCWIRISIVSILRIVLGTFCMALAVNLIYTPLGMVTGGLSGLAIIIRDISLRWLPFVIPVWLSNFVMNVPVFVAAFWVMGRQYGGMSLFANLCFTTALYLLPVKNLLGTDLLLAAVLGGVFSGIGLGLVLSYGYSTGGTDLLSVIIHHFFSYYPVGYFLFVLDSLIIGAGAWQFGLQKAIYAVVAVYLTTKIMDAIIEGGKFAKLAWIISDAYEEISRELMSHLGRGVTMLEGMGMYTGKERKTLLCVVGRKQIVQVCRIARKFDENAFVIISDIREVQGEGFVEKPQL